MKQEVHLSGAHSDLKKCEEGGDEHILFITVKDILESATFKTFERYEVIGYTSQVVAGTIFQVKIRVLEGETGFIHAKIIRHLPHTGLDPEVLAWQIDQTESSLFNFDGDSQQDVEMSQEGVVEESKPQVMKISSMVNQQEATMLKEMGFS